MDDPAFAIVAATERDAQVIVSTVIWLFVALGLRLSWAKGSFGHSVRWIGAVVTVVSPARLHVHLPGDFLDKVLDAVDDPGSAVDVADVRRLAGRLGWAATVVSVLRPFASSLWAAIAGAERDQAGRPGQGRGREVRGVPVRVGRARLAHSYSWVRALCGAARDGLHTIIPLDDSEWHRGYTVIADASPWGGGAFLSERGVPVAWWATAWTEEDARECGVKVGDHRSQALVEALAILISVRCWASFWTSLPTVLAVKSDSMAAIGGIEKGGTTRSADINRVLQEIALSIAVSPTGLRLAFQHLPGERNQWADALSRIAQPGSGAQVPAPLLACTKTDVEGRGAGYWLTGLVPTEVLEVAPEGEEKAVVPGAGA